MRLDQFSIEKLHASSTTSVVARLSNRGSHHSPFSALFEGLAQELVLALIWLDSGGQDAFVTVGMSMGQVSFRKP
jgi:hypothetical protein